MGSSLEIHPDPDQGLAMDPICGPSAAEELLTQGARARRLARAPGSKASCFTGVPRTFGDAEPASSRVGAFRPLQSFPPALGSWHPDGKW